jgi:hypothetical protein
MSNYNLLARKTDSWWDEIIEMCEALGFDIMIENNKLYINDKNYAAATEMLYELNELLNQD